MDEQDMDDTIAVSEDSLLGYPGCSGFGILQFYLWITQGLDQYCANCPPAATLVTAIRATVAEQRTLPYPPHRVSPAWQLNACASLPRLRPLPPLASHVPITLIVAREVHSSIIEIYRAQVLIYSLLR